MAFYNPLVKPKAKQNRNGFDLSQRHLFSAKVGQLLPILSIDCVPNDYHEIDVASLLKTMPVRTDSFARMTQHFEFYFVPYQLMMSNFNDVLLQGNTESISSLISSTSHNLRVPKTPCFSLPDLLTKLSSFGSSPRISECKDMFGVPYSENTYRLLDLLGYGSYYSLRRPEQSGGGHTIDSEIVSTYQGKFMNLFRIGAYNKIWYDYYRNKYYDNDANYVYSWNFDDIVTGSSVSDRSWIANDYEDIVCEYFGAAPSLFNMHYRQWKKDFFTSLMPSQQFGAVSSVDLSNLTINAANYQTTTRVTLYAKADGIVGNQLSDSSYNTKYNINNAFDVYALRRAEVLQGWKEDTLRAGHNTQSQYRAHFGTTSKYSSLSTCEFVGACSAPVNISEVVSTADTSNASLGAIAGKGSSFANGKLKFNCSDFGVLMCIYSIVPESDYDALGCDKQNTMLEPFDFFTPAFEDLGLEPVYTYQLSMVGQPGITTLPSAGTYIDSVMGYSTRYSCYKTAVDKIHGEFMSRGMDMIQDSQAVTGSLASWTIARSDLDSFVSGMPLLRHYYISPFIDNTIFFASGYQQDMDHFLVDANFGIKSVRDMSVLGLPRW